MVCQSLTTWPKLCHGTPVLDYNLMASLEPVVGQMWHGGKKIISPGHPYTAACARNAVYFIDQRFDIESAKHIKAQLENLVPGANGYWFIDEIDAIAERKDINGTAVFKFDPTFARVFFAGSMNLRNPSLKLPVHEPAGDWLVVYDVENAVVGGRAKRIGTGLSPRKNDAVSRFQTRDDCENFGLNADDDCCIAESTYIAGDHQRAKSKSREIASANAVGSFVAGIRKAAVDTPRFKNESDAEYYQRMDELHWK